MVLRRSWLPWLLCAILQPADIATTAVALSTRAATEGNATARAIMQSYGQPAAYTVKAVGIGLVLLALWHYRHRLWARVTLWAAVGLGLVAVVNNVAFLASTR